MYDLITNIKIPDGGPFAGCKLTYQGNVLYCSRHRTFKENRGTTIEALRVLVGFEIPEEEIMEFGKIEPYRSR